MDRDSCAHTGVVRVLVGDEPVRSEKDARNLIEMIRTEMAHYRDHGRYPGPTGREHVQALFQRAITVLEPQTR